MEGHVQDAAAMVAAIISKHIRRRRKDKVIQVIPENASACATAGRLVMAKYPQNLWARARHAAHCLDLALKDISKIRRFHTTITEVRVGQASRQTSAALRHAER